MAVQIATWFMDERLPFTNEDFHLFALEFYYQCTGRRKTRSNVWQGPSVGFTTEFKKRWGFTTKKARVSHVAKNPDLEKQMVSYREECKRWIRRVGPGMFFNFDETFWRLLQNCLTCWGVKSKPLKIKTRGNEKTGITLGFTVAADGKSLPILLIAKGSTAKSLKKFNLKQFKGDVVATTTKKGWSTKQAMMFYLDEILIPYTGGALACLTWDTYSSHLEDEVIKHAMEHNIHIIPTPPGGTAEGDCFFSIVHRTNCF